MPTGVVARFDCRRGYGFVIPDDGGEDVFVHQNNIEMEGFRYLKSGEQVRYELEVGEKGMKAVQVELLSPRAPDDHPFHREDQGDGDRRRAPSRPAQRRGHDRQDDREWEMIDRLRRKQERLISLLVAKGVLTPGEIDGVDEPAAGEDAEQDADDAFEASDSYSDAVDY